MWSTLVAIWPEVLASTIGPFVLLSLFGFYRIQRMQDVLMPDWQILAEFGAALRAFTQSAGHDARALGSLTALAPDIAPLIFGFHAASHRPVPAGIESHPPPEAAPDASPAVPRVALSPEVLFARLEDLPHAFDDPPGPTTQAERDRLENLRGQVLGAEWLLQSEMKRLNRQEASVNAWLFEGMAGLVLLATPAGGRPDTSARTRRRMIEADPRFQLVVRAFLFLFMALFLAGLLAGLMGLLRHLGARVAG